nr:MHC class I antigen ZJA transcript variant 2 [Danio rerio]
MTSFDRSFTLLYLCLFHVIMSSFRAEKHSLYFIYTGLSRPVDLPGIYEFSAMGLLDDRQIDSYNSEEQRNIPKQQWMKEKMQEDYWENRTQSRKEKQLWFYDNVHLLIDRNRQSTSDGTDLDGIYTGHPPETVPVVIGSVLIFLAILGVVVFLVMKCGEQDSSSTDTTECTSILLGFIADHLNKELTEGENW